MDRTLGTRIAWLLVLLGTTVACPGCLIVSASRDVVRGNERWQPVRFESDEARAAFDARANDKSVRDESHRDNTFAVPFLLFYRRESVLSDAAWHNDQITACDTNGDGLITLEEALAYNPKYAGEITKVNASKPAVNGPSSSPQPTSFQQPLNAPPLP